MTPLAATETWPMRLRCEIPSHLYGPGTDDLSMVVGEHFQLPLDQRFDVLADVGKLVWRSGRIELQVAFGILFKLPLPNSGRAAGYVPGVTGGVQAIL